MQSGKSEDEKALAGSAGYSRDFRQSKWHYTTSAAGIGLELGTIRQKRATQPSATLRKPRPDGFALWHLWSVPVTLL